MKHTFRKTLFFVAAVVFMLISCKEKNEPVHIQAAGVLEEAREPPSPALEDETVFEVKNQHEEEKEDKGENESLASLSLADFYIDPSAFIREDERYVRGMGILHDFSSLYILGFSKDGKLAYIRTMERDGVGNTAITFTIQDLVSDETVFVHNAYLPDDFEDTEGFVQKNSYTFDKALSEHHIHLAKAAYNALPFTAEGTTVHVRANIYDTGERLHEFVRIIDYACIAENGRGTKTIAQKKHTTVEDVFVCGYVKNPFEARIAVVIAEAVFGFEGYDLQYSIVGCDTQKGFTP